MAWWTQKKKAETVWGGFKLQDIVCHTYVANLVQHWHPFLGSGQCWVRWACKHLMGIRTVVRSQEGRIGIPVGNGSSITCSQSDVRQSPRGTCHCSKPVQTVTSGPILRPCLTSMPTTVTPRMDNDGCKRGLLSTPLFTSCFRLDLALLGDTT